MTRIEKIKVFDLSGKFLGIEDRKKFYTQAKAEFKKTGKVNKQVQTVKIILMNKGGGIYLAKRSRFKKQNSLLYDKTIGAHISEDESEEYTVLKECAEELGFPAAVLNETEFNAALHETDLSMVGIFKKIKTQNKFMSHRIHQDGNAYVFPQIASIYIGVYDGTVKFKDGETSGIEIYYPDEILERIKSRPKRYTQEVRYLIEEFLKEIKKIIKKIPDNEPIFSGTIE